MFSKKTPRRENINNPDECARELPTFLIQPGAPQYSVNGVKVWLEESYNDTDTQLSLISNSLLMSQTAEEKLKTRAREGENKILPKFFTAALFLNNATY